MNGVAIAATPIAATINRFQIFIKPLLSLLSVRIAERRWHV